MLTFVLLVLAVMLWGDLLSEKEIMILMILCLLFLVFSDSVRITSLKEEIKTEEVKD